MSQTMRRVAGKPELFAGLAHQVRQAGLGYGVSQMVDRR